MLSQILSIKKYEISQREGVGATSPVEKPWERDLIYFLKNQRATQ